MATPSHCWSSEDAVSLSVELRHLDGAVHLHVSGDLDFSTARRLSEAVEAANSDGHRLVVLELSGLAFCDAAGVTALLRAHRTARGQGGRLLIRGAAGLPRRVLAITGVDQVLDIE
jgi:anti-anti-sigma factor